MYARETLNALGETVTPLASTIGGALVFVKSANSVPPTRTRGLSSGGGFSGVRTPWARAGLATNTRPIASPHHQDRRFRPARTELECSSSTSSPDIHVR